MGGERKKRKGKIGFGGQKFEEEEEESERDKAVERERGRTKK